MKARDRFIRVTPAARERPQASSDNAAAWFGGLCLALAGAVLALCAWGIYQVFHLIPV